MKISLNYRQLNPEELSEKLKTHNKEYQYSAIMYVWR